MGGAQGSQKELAGRGAGGLEQLSSQLEKTPACCQDRALAVSFDGTARQLLCLGRSAKGSLITAKVKAVQRVIDTLLRNKQKGIAGHLISPDYQS